MNRFGDLCRYYLSAYHLEICFQYPLSRPQTAIPSFLILAPGGKLTPLPLNIFDITEIRAGLIRYDNNEQSKYGITIQPEDERGAHRMGFVCQPQAMTNEDIRSVFKDLTLRAR